MYKTQVCMFCRYRKIAAERSGSSACCPGEEIRRVETAGAAARTSQGPGLAIPDHGRSPNGAGENTRTSRGL
jgi:hypothetical protein